MFVKNKTGCKGGGLDLWQGEPAFTRNCSRGTTKGQISSISHRATNRLVLFIYFPPHESSCHGADNVLFAHTDNLKKKPQQILRDGVAGHFVLDYTSGFPEHTTFLPFACFIPSFCIHPLSTKSKMLVYISGQGYNRDEYNGGAFIK